MSRRCSGFCLYKSPEIYPANASQQEEAVRASANLR
jgi:hypothetical protein